MPDYRRARVPGGTWFFTVNLLERRTSLLVDNIEWLNTSIRRTKRRHPFRIEALVVLPDHLHAILTLPEGDADFSMRWRLIRSAFSKSLPKTEWLSAVRKRRGERGVWQRRYWEHFIRDERDLAHHMAYCHFNPVKHRLVERIADWPHSTFHRDVRCGRALPEVDVSMLDEMSVGEDVERRGVERRR